MKDNIYCVLIIKGGIAKITERKTEVYTKGAWPKEEAENIVVGLLKGGIPKSDIIIAKLANFEVKKILKAEISREEPIVRIPHKPRKELIDI